jgi:hypothetical protein
MAALEDANDLLRFYAGRRMVCQSRQTIRAEKWWSAIAASTLTEFLLRDDLTSTFSG